MPSEPLEIVGRIILPVASILLLSGYKVGAVSTHEPSNLSPQSVELQSYKISQNNERDTSKLEKALLGRWVTEPLFTGKTFKLIYYFSSQNIWQTGQEIDGKQVLGGQFSYKVIKVNEKDNSLRIRYGVGATPESLKLEATVVFSPDRQGMYMIFHTQGIDVPGLSQFKYAGS